MKERKQQTLYISRKDNSVKKMIEMNEHSLKQFSQHLNFPVYAIMQNTGQ